MIKILGIFQLTVFNCGRSIIDLTEQQLMRLSEETLNKICNIFWESTKYSVWTVWQQVFSYINIEFNLCSACAINFDAFHRWDQFVGIFRQWEGLLWTGSHAVVEWKLGNYKIKEYILFRGQLIFVLVTDPETRENKKLPLITE